MDMSRQQWRGYEHDVKVLSDSLTCENNFENKQ